MRDREIMQIVNSKLGYTEMIRYGLYIIWYQMIPPYNYCRIICKCQKTPSR